MLKNFMWNIKCLKKDRVWAFEIWIKYVKLGQILRDETQPNLGHEARVAKHAYTLVQPVVRNKVLFFL